MAEPEGGNPATEQGAVGSDNPPPEPQKTEAELRAELETLRGRYQESTEEGKRRAAQVEELNTRLKSLEQARSLTDQERQQQQANQFPTREQYADYWVAKGMTQEAAAARYDIDAAQFQREQFLAQQIQALGNRMKFREELDAQLQAETNPDVKAAVDFWKDNAVMAALPIPEQLKAHKATLEKLGVTGARDTRRQLDDVKRAATGAGVGGGRGAAPAATAEEDSQAKSLGFPSAKAMAEFSKCTTPAEARAWETKWKTKL
jgi:hypothetical protein